MGKNTKGQNCVGYAVTTQTEVLIKEKLPSNFSAQSAELKALIEACKMFKGKHVTIYTDSAYTFGSVHQFCKQWSLRGFKTATGQEVALKAPLQELLEAIKLPKSIAVCKCAAHTKGTDDISVGNRLADKAAKAAAKIYALHIKTSESEPENILQDYQNRAPSSEKRKWKTKGCELKNDLYIGPDDKPWLPKSFYK